MNGMFRKCTRFEGRGIGAWDTSSVENMATMFLKGRAFNADISAWEMSSVTATVGMFHGCRLFNSDISNWNLSSARDVRGMSILLC